MSVKDKIRLTARGYRMIHTLVPGYLTVMGIDALLSSILPFINIFMSARIITALAAQKSLEQVFRLALITAALNVLTALLSSALQRLSAYSNAKFYQFFEKPLTDKVAQMDYERVEDTEVHLKKECIMLLRRTSGWGLSRLIWCYTGTLSGVLTTVFSISLLGGAFSTRHTIDAGAWDFIFSPATIFVVLLLISVNLAVGIFLTKISSKKEADWMIDLTQINRLGSYYFSNLLSYKAGKDLKLYALKAPMLAEFSEIMAQYSKPMRVLFKMTAKNHSLIAASNTVMTGIIYAYVTLKALFGSFGVGSIVQYVGSLARLNDGVSTTMWNITMLNSNIEPLKLFFEFIDMPDKKHQGTLPVEKRNDNDYEIEFCGVSFKYPGTDVYALRDLNLKLAIGQRLAVVGMNGSGKTTMIKLLCRLYDPTEGEIKLNGIDIKKYDYNEY